MLKDMAVFNSSSVNRYGMAFTIEALESGLEQSFDLGMPSFVSHDYHRPIGWSRGLSLFIEPGVAKVTGLYLKPENIEDSQEIMRAVKYYLTKKTAEFYEPHGKELESKLKDHIIGTPNPHMPSCAAMVNEGLAVRCFPELFGIIDKDGLVPLDLLTPIAPGVFEKDGLLIFAHPYFRRSLSRLNSLNEPFFKAVQEVKGEEALSIKIALDRDMVGLAKSYLDHIELEYWWGPKFDDDLSKIEVGVATHSVDDREQFFHGISKTEFWWHAQNDLKTLECEELRDIPSYGVGEDKFGCRYVHSIVDPDNKQPFHLDGAVRIYSEEEMISRIEMKISESGRNTHYVKLWRVDGKLEVNKWKNILTHYYRDNSLIGEYLGGTDEEEFKPHLIVCDQLQKPISKYVPSDLQGGAGIRLSISYQNMFDPITSECLLQCFDTLWRDTAELRYVESDTWEIVKLIRKRGGNVEIPKDVVFIAFEDMVINFPLIQHLGKKSVELANLTHDAIIDLCNAWACRGDDRIITYNIGIQYESKNINFSIAGHVKDLSAWHKRKESRFPDNEKDIGKWCSMAEKLITKVFPKANDTPRLSDVLRHSGLIVVNRRFLDPESYRMRYDNVKKALVCDLLIEKENTSLLRAIDSKNLKVACAFLVNESICSNCKTSYNSCNCSKYIDKGVCQEVSDAKLLAPFWTNRKA